MVKGKILCANCGMKITGKLKVMYDDDKDDYKGERVYVVANPDYKKGFELLEAYWDNLDDDEKVKVDKELKKCGL